MGSRTVSLEGPPFQATDVPENRWQRSNTKTMESQPVRSAMASRFRSSVDVAGGVALLAAALVMIVLGVTLLRAINTAQSGPQPPGRPEPLPGEPIETGGAPSLGNAGAPVYLIVFSDFQCPVCSRFVTHLLPPIRERYIDSGKVALSFRHLPLESIHPLAFAAAEAAECAARQGGFWPMHDRLFAPKAQLHRQALSEAARAIGLEPKAFEACMGSGEAEPRIRADMAIASGLLMRGTPAFLVGRAQADGKVKVSARFAGIPRDDSLTKALDAALASGK